MAGRPTGRLPSRWGGGPMALRRTRAEELLHPLAEPAVELPAGRSGDILPLIGRVVAKRAKATAEPATGGFARFGSVQHGDGGAQHDPEPQSG